MDEPEYDDCETEGCTCGGKPPYVMGFSVSPAGCIAMVYVADSAVKGHEVMLVKDVMFSGDDLPEEVHEAVRNITDVLNLKVKAMSVQLIHEVDQAEAFFNDPDRD